VRNRAPRIRIVVGPEVEGGSGLGGGISDASVSALALAAAGGVPLTSIAAIGASEVKTGDGGRVALTLGITSSD